VQYNVSGCYDIWVHNNAMKENILIKNVCYLFIIGYNIGNDNLFPSKIKYK